MIEEKKVLIALGKAVELGEIQFSEVELKFAPKNNRESKRRYSAEKDGLRIEVIADYFDKFCTNVSVHIDGSRLRSDYEFSSQHAGNLLRNIQTKPYSDVVSKAAATLLTSQTEQVAEQDKRRVKRDC
jgi:hypothetical protein